MAINSRSKGKRGERMAVNFFKRWTNRTFSTTPRSGGLHWQKSNVAGDIVCTQEGHYFPFTVEVKFHAKIDFSHLLNPKIKNVDILDFWKQAVEDAERVHKIPLLLMRYDGLPKDFFFVAFSQSFLNCVSEAKPGKPRDGKMLMYANFKGKEEFLLCICPSDQFLKLPYKEIKKAAKTHLRHESKRK